MKKKSPFIYLKDEHGVAMLLELALVAAVLLLVGLAVYQTNHRLATNNTSVQSTPAPPSSAQGIAASAAAATLQDSATDASLSATAEATTNEVSQTDQDVSNLGGSSNGSF